MLFTKELKGFPLISQLIPADVNEYNDCGPTCLAMVIKYFTGQYRDPQSLVDSYYGAGYVGYTNFTFLQAIINRWNWPNYTYNVNGKGEMIRQLNRSLTKGHPTIALVWEDIGQATPVGHFEVVVGTWYKLRTGTRYYHLANPNGGVLDTVTAAQLWGFCQNAWLVIQHSAPNKQAKGK